MLLLLRKLKRNFFQNSEFRKYLGYALGEMALVVIGILIALQIDNWNTEKLQQESLQNYLRTIARNIGSDLAAISDLRSDRQRANELAVRRLVFDARAMSHSIRDIVIYSQVLNEASTFRHFNASTSGYEALKSSGVLDQMQGTDIEKLVYDYYDATARITHSERDYNELNRLLSLQVAAQWPGGLASWEVSSAAVLTGERFAELKPAYRQLLGNHVTQELSARPMFVGQLLLEYDKLDRLGRAFRHLVEVESMNLDDDALRILDGIYDPRSGLGQPNIVVNGQLSLHSYRVIASDANDPRVSYNVESAGLPSPFDPDSFRKVGDRLHIDYHGGAAWAGIWFAAGYSEGERWSPDYSTYTTIVLELKGDAGGEKIIVNMEDRDDPGDGTSTRYELELSDQWQIYEIDLAEFETADLTMLSVPLGFVFLDGPVSFSIRNARFVKRD